MISTGKTQNGALARVLSAFLAASLYWLTPVNGSCKSFQYIDLHPAGWISSFARCVNDAGEVAGYGMTVTGERGFVRSGGTFREILPPGTDSARANWINGFGDVAVTAHKGGVPHAFLLRGGAYLDPTPGWGWSEATYVGEDGAVAGNGEYGVYISRDGATEIFPGFSSVAGGNSSGQWVGGSGTSSLLYLPGQGYLDVTPPGATDSTPHGINESGLVAVVARKTGTTKGYVKSGEFYIDMTPAGWSSSLATAINDLNEVVGYGDSTTGRRSFLRSGGTNEEIAFPGWQSTEAVSLNNAGQVSGAGTTAGGEIHAFLATPAPGPPGGGAGGCAVVSGNRVATEPVSSAANLLWFGVPLLFLRRRNGSSGSAFGSSPYRAPK